jgi:hypothetical protein
LTAFGPFRGDACFRAPFNFSNEDTFDFKSLIQKIGQDDIEIVDLDGINAEDLLDDNDIVIFSLPLRN